MLRSWFLACLLIVFTAPCTAAGQSRSADLLAIARAHIATRQWDSADVALTHALESAPYIMDSCWSYVWRGVLEYERGHYRLARSSFRRAFALYPDPGIRSLDTISTGLAKLFDAEFRANRTFQQWDLDQPARRLSFPPFDYPRELRARRISGTAVVRMIVDTLGRVDEKSIDILEIPDSAFAMPVKRMMSNGVFIPARLDGKPVRSLVAYHIELRPPPPRDPVRLIDLARRAVRMDQPDSALVLLEDALDPVNGVSPAVAVYADFVRGLAWQAKHDSVRAAGSFEQGLAHYHVLKAQGVDFAPFVRSLADSVASRAPSREARRTSSARPQCGDGWSWAATWSSRNAGHPARHRSSAVWSRQRRRGSGRGRA
jgi:hypothetical protein